MADIRAELRSKTKVHASMRLLGPRGSGDNGATFTPNLSENGDLSWSNDKGLQNPAPVNIKGPKGDSGGYYTPDFKEVKPGVLRVNFEASKTDMPSVPPMDFELPSGGNDSVENATLYIGPDEPTGDNRPMYWLDTSMDDAPVQPEEPEEPDVPVEPGKTLTGITAVYTGGSVPVGTAVSALTGITVTASYSDGSTAAVTGYTLSGTIVEGSNTITVTYQGKTATFTVTGVASGGGELPDISTFVLDVPYLVSNAKLGADVSSNNNAAVVAAGNAAANLPITDYLNSDYAELYAISFRPNASDPYGGPTGWRAYRYGHLGDNVPVWQEQTQIASISINSTSGVDANRLRIHKLVRADILAALDGTEYTAEDIRAIIQYVPNAGSKNHNVSVVWMATMPTEEQQRAIIAYFEGGGN